MVPAPLKETVHLSIWVPFCFLVYACGCPLCCFSGILIYIEYFLIIRKNLKFAPLTQDLTIKHETRGSWILKRFFFNLKHYIQKGLELIKEFSEVAGYEINKEIICISYTNNEISEKGIT